MRDAQTNLAGLDSEMREMVVDTVRQFKERLFTKKKILELDKDEVFPEKMIREMLSPDIGLQLVLIPEKYGGMGGGARDTCAVTREMSKICLGISTAFFALQLGADPIVVGGTESQKKKWLGRIAEGNSLVAYAVTEAGAGSNLAALKTKAEPVRDDSGKITGYKINGTKQFISNGGYADFITVLANCPEGRAFFIVEKGTEGFVQGKGEEKHGIRSSNTSPLSLNDVFVPVENLIGEKPGQGMKQSNKVFGYTRLMVAAMALGGAEAALKIAIPYAKERIQFGSPLSEKQGYTHKLIIPHVVRLEAADIYIDEIATILDSGDYDLQTEGSIAKYFTSEAANNAADDMMQALGGYGYIAEYEVEKIKRDVKITCIYEGTSEIQQNIISMFRWKKTWKSKGKFYENIALEMDEIHSSVNDIGADFYALAARILNETIMSAHKNRLTKQQHIMFALADLITWLEVGASVVRKAKKLADANDLRAAEIKTISKIFAYETASVFNKKVMEILMGSKAFDEKSFSEFKEKFSFDRLSDSFIGVIEDMDTLADIIFER
ncbi:Acyl-CoA dehydrogenase [Candidatus Magnetomoraceae bacterium gMMP-15]